MKGVHCSWVDMMKIRQMLAGKKRGDQKALTGMRCIGASTVSTWRAACDVVDAVEKKVQLNELSHFQPTHAVEIAKSFRKTYGKEWSQKAGKEIAQWVEQCEAEEWTVKELQAAHRGPVGKRSNRRRGRYAYCFAPLEHP
jgi:hypothetical protein